MKIKCSQCKTKKDFSYTHIGNGQWLCRKCQSPGTVLDMAKLGRKVYIDGYGHVSEARVRALESRVMLPDNRTDGAGDYYVGSKTASGKILDRSPDIRP